MPSVSGATLFEEESAAASGGLVRLVFQLDGRTEMDHMIEVGQTVAFVKVRAMEIFGFDETLAANPASLMLSLQSGQELLDPMSLNDYPEMVPGGTVIITATSVH